MPRIPMKQIVAMHSGAAIACALFLSLGAPTAAEKDGCVPLYNGKDMSGGKVPEADDGHWKGLHGVIDYDAESEAKGEKSLASEKDFGDFVLRAEWRLKETPYINPNVPY